ncbi:MAG: hypothetical protein ABI411_04535 [Tahibacter sp.]
MFRIGLAIVSAVLMSWAVTAHGAQAVDERREKIESMEASPTPEALQRKERSESVLKIEAVPINKFLLVIETEKEAKRRTKEEVAA